MRARSRRARDPGGGGAVAPRTLRASDEARAARDRALARSGLPALRPRLPQLRVPVAPPAAQAVPRARAAADVFGPAEPRPARRRRDATNAERALGSGHRDVPRSGSFFAAFAQGRACSGARLHIRAQGRGCATGRSLRARDPAQYEVSRSHAHLRDSTNVELPARRGMPYVAEARRGTGTTSVRAKELTFMSFTTRYDQPSRRTVAACFAATTAYQRLFHEFALYLAAATFSSTSDRAASAACAVRHELDDAGSACARKP